MHALVVENQKKDNFKRSLIERMLESQKRWCVAVPKQEGERVRRELKELSLLDERYKIEERNGQIHIPFKGGPHERRYNVEACHVDLRPQTRLKKLGISYDTIGDIAIIGWFDGARAVATELLKTQKNIKVVFAAVSGVSGEYRLKDLICVAGERRTETEHKEYGSRLLIDVSRVYFSPRLATERHRLVELAQSDEAVADMFAGAGPFTILLAKKVKNAIAFELNPAAFRYLKRNIELNKLDNVKACLGDAKDLAPRFAGVADRVIMNLPHSAFNFLGEALTMLSSDGGFVHYYDVKPENEFPKTIERVNEFVQNRDRNVETIHLKKVRSYAPRQYHIAIDLKIAPS
ncbi:MAG TPA: class I SAM-dependent methyltransferase family protein [archaeon]